MNAVAVDNNEVRIVKDSVVFVYTRDMVEQHLSEGWMPDESAICEVDGVELELYPRHYKHMLELMDSYSPCECDNTEGRFYQNHGCCEYCFYVG